MAPLRYIAAIDQGTSSSRCVIFDSNINIVSSDQQEHTQIFPQAGWVEHDAEEIWDKVQSVVRGALEKAHMTAKDLSAVGITNQRESTVVWDRNTGQPLHNVIVWNDTRTEGICRRLEARVGSDRFRDTTGLPIATYFSATKLMWLLENVPRLREAAEHGDALFGTVDSWLVWKLTRGRRHVTDATNASRTLLMDIRTLDWSPDILATLGVPRRMLPEIASSSEVYGQVVEALLEGVPIAGILGDQQAALFGQTCFDAGQAKCTYGTGAFILMNTGRRLVPSAHGLLSTVGYKLGGADPVYALEGSIAYAGSVVQWCRDGLGIISHTSEVEVLARGVADNGGVYFVPAFAGLYAPHWRGDARGTVCGLTAFANRGHLARAVLEASAYQVTEVLAAMRVDSDVALQVLKVDGGMTANELLMQFQADLLDTEVLRPRVVETTSLGAAFAAGLAVGVWTDLQQLRGSWRLDRRYKSRMADGERTRLLAHWNKALNRSLNWIDGEEEAESEKGIASAASARGAISPPRPRQRARWRVVPVAGVLAALAIAAFAAGVAAGRRHRP